MKRCLSEADGLMDIDVPRKELGEVAISPVKRAVLAPSDDDRLIVVAHKGAPA